MLYTFEIYTTYYYVEVQSSSFIEIRKNNQNIH